MTNKATQPSELETLALQAEGMTDTNTGPAEGQDATQDAPAPEPTNAQMIAGAIAAGRTVFCMVTKLESPKVHLNDEAAQQLGAVWGPVCDKYGWNLNDALGSYGVEIAAIAVTAQIGYALHRAVTEEIASRNAKPVQAEEVQPEAVDSVG